MTPKAQAYVAQNLVALAVEVLKWRKEGFIRGGCLRELQNLLPMPPTDPLSMSTAASMVENAGLVNVIAQHTGQKKPLATPAAPPAPKPEKKQKSPPAPRPYKPKPTHIPL